MISAAIMLLAFTLSTEALAHDPEGHKDLKGSMINTAVMDRHPVPVQRGPHGQRGQRSKGVTPYGDFCSRCNKYGVGQRPVTHKVALEALEEYFTTKNLTVKNVRGSGRFLKADIYKADSLVDRILFDRRTGRVRSIF